jgi:hypothetical protein
MIPGHHGPFSAALWSIPTKLSSRIRLGYFEVLHSFTNLLSVESLGFRAFWEGRRHRAE